MTTQRTACRGNCGRMLTEKTGIFLGPTNLKRKLPACRDCYEKECREFATREWGRKDVKQNDPGTQQRLYDGEFGDR